MKELDSPEISTKAIAAKTLCVEGEVLGGSHL